MRGMSRRVRIGKHNGRYRIMDAETGTIYLVKRGDYKCGAPKMVARDNGGYGSWGKANRVKIAINAAFARYDSDD